MKARSRKPLVKSMQNSIVRFLFFPSGRAAKGSMASMLNLRRTMEKIASFTEQNDKQCCCEYYLSAWFGVRSSSENIISVLLWLSVSPIPTLNFRDRC